MALTGRRTMSESAPAAWFVEEPSAPQAGKNDIGISATSVNVVDSGIAGSVKTLVFARSAAVGAVPSIQMYSASILIVLPQSGVGKRPFLCLPIFFNRGMLAFQPYLAIKMG